MKNFANLNKITPNGECVCCHRKPEEIDCDIYPVKYFNVKRMDIICSDCLDITDDYDFCETCKKIGDEVVYEIGDLFPGDDGDKFYCRDHRGDGCDPPTENDMDYIEHCGKD